MKHLSKFGLGPLSALSAAVLALVAGCSSPPPPRPTPPIVQPPAPVPPPLVSIEPDPFEFVTIRSEATTPRDYRRDAAKHLINELKQTSPAVVEELIPGLMKLSEVQQVLQMLMMRLLRI